jgi:thiol-disulfide isomerase/thioredoxin
LNNLGIIFNRKRVSNVIIFKNIVFESLFKDRTNYKNSIIKFIGSDTSELNKYLSFEIYKLVFQIQSFNQFEIDTFTDLMYNKFANKIDSIKISKILIENGITNVINDISLLNINNDTLSFLNIIKSRKIKYIDLWASWCAPCLSAMPSSFKLRERYKDKNINFIYLAINDKINNWKKAYNEIGLKDYKYNYFIINSKSSKLLETLNVNAIPRYLIYDEWGNLINRNAPGPDNKALIPLLDKLLK